MPVSNIGFNPIQTAPTTAATGGMDVRTMAAIIEADLNKLKQLAAQMGIATGPPTDVFQSSGGGYGASAPASGNLSADNPFTLPQPIQQAPATVGNEVAEADASRTTIAVIDNFKDDEDGFNHGETVAGIIESGGQTPENADSIDTIRMDVSNEDGESINDASIADSLDQLITRVQNGEDLDAVNLSLGTSDPNAENADEIRAKVEELSALGVPVVFAAGNEGEGTRNALAPEDVAFSVEALRNGEREDYSSDGNLAAEIPPDIDLDGTSFAAPNIATLIASMDNAGLSIADIRNRLIA
ncbi:MAG: S8 family serine peptidase [Vampirovibrionales bacterium]|nr:S8 family serine peptidase [Vampirovibrionales bacterium]